MRFLPETPITDLPSVKTIFATKFATLGIRTLQDLLFHIPTRYEDFTTIKSLNEALDGVSATFVGTVSAVREKKTWKRKMTLYEAVLHDATGSIRLVWFNQKLIAESLTPGLRIRVSGKVSTDTEGLVIRSPAFERASRRPTHTARLVPVYPETYGLTSKYIRWQIETILTRGITLPDPLPETIRLKLHLPTLPDAIRRLHFPDSTDDVALAKKRLAFDEIFLAQLKSVEQRSLWDEASAIAFPDEASFLPTFEPSLPFALTTAQRRSIKEVFSDLSRSKPMSRLVNGDVGSGKTVVAAIAALRVARNGHQVALLAPTEILARQHFETFSAFFAKESFHIALLTRSYRMLQGETVAKETLKNAIRAGLPSIIIGTHALLQQSVSFNNLALVIIDEQHRFGVAQRAALQEITRNADDGIAGKIPHLLTLTATPIPRTLAIAILGNLDLSLLDELPKNRATLTTRIAATPEAKSMVFRFARQEIKKGRQVFVILPLVEESAALSEVKAAKTEHEKLSTRIFPEYTVGLLHGKMKSAEKEKVMQSFSRGETQILVSTSVVEVGIDVPNATVMIIENADRFGLTQLHQFRGRVGRGTDASFCFLLPGKDGEGMKRLKVLTETRDGFTIAERDLEFRGAGEFFGLRQSGVPDIALEHLTNERLIKISRDEVVALFADDPGLSRHPLLRATLDRMTREVHLE